MGEYGETIDVQSPFFRRLSDDAAILKQALWLRLQTRRGTYWDDPDYGVLVDDYLNNGLTPEALVRVAAELKAECEKDERVSSAAVVPKIEPTSGGYWLRPEVSVFPKTGQPFSFVLPASDLTGPALRKRS